MPIGRRSCWVPRAGLSFAFVYPFRERRTDEDVCQKHCCGGIRDQITANVEECGIHKVPRGWAPEEEDYAKYESTRNGCGGKQKLLVEGEPVSFHLSSRGESRVGFV